MQRIAVFLYISCIAHCFQVPDSTSSRPFLLERQRARPAVYTQPPLQLTKQETLYSPTKLYATDNDSESVFLTESDQTLLGAVGVIASGIMLYSEYTLKSTGCGLPAGPAGILGAAEGVSYLFVVGLAGYSLLTKFKTGSGLPSGPGGILGAAEGLSFLAIIAGIAVLGFQLLDYGYIPNAVPMEGGMCS